MRWYYFFLPFASLLFIACSGHRIKENVNKIGEKAGEVVGEAAKGVTRGVENSFEMVITRKDTNTLHALAFGKILLASDSGSNDNRLSVYIIYTNDFNREVLLKVFEKSGLEIGRSKKLLKGKKEEAGYVDFIFDTKTNIDRDCTIIME